MEIRQLNVLLQPNIAISKAQKELHTYIAKQLQLDTSDLCVWGAGETIQRFQTLYTSLKGISWFVGLCVLLSGLIGISNMMLVIVKERTQEIGIRKVLGAHPKTLVGMFLAETLLITLLAGIIGIAVGWGSLQLINSWVDQAGDLPITQVSFQTPSISLAYCIVALAGCLAASIPVKKALSIPPIQALKTV